MSIYGFFFLLLVTKSMALWDSYPGIRSWKSSAHARAVPPLCTQEGVTCSNCQESYFCPPGSVGNAAPTVIPCSSTDVCSGPDPGSQGCIDPTGDDVNAGDCDCGNIGNSGILADPYDETRYLICISSEQQILVACADGFVFSSDSNTCVEKDVEPTDPPIPVVDCEVEGIGFHTTDPKCQSYTLCFSENLPGIPYQCPEGEAFDVSLSRCVAQCSLGPSSFSCLTSGFGAFPDTSDCTIFHVCSNGDVFAADISCADGEMFEPTSMRCVSASPSVACPVINDCWAAYCDACGETCPKTISIPDPSSSSTSTIITTTTVSTGGTNDPPNCNNGSGYYAYAADCKQFWSCQADDAGVYEAILYRCPGNLYFIPSLSYCSLQSDLPINSGCTLITA